MTIGISQVTTPSIQHQLFPAKYFTGADCGIYFGDVFIDDLVQLEFSLQERVLPLMGYASYTHHRVARGVRQIQGSFTINFRNSGYLYSVLDHVGRMAKTEHGAVPYVARLLNIDKSEEPEWIAKANESIEQLLDRVHKPKVTRKIPERWHVPLRVGDGDPSAKNTDPAWMQKVDSIGHLKTALVRRGFLTQTEADDIVYFDVALQEALIRFQKAYGIDWNNAFDLATSQQLTEVEYDRPFDGLDASSRMQEMEKMIWGSGGAPDAEGIYRPHFSSGEFTSYLANKGFDIYIIYGALDQTAARTGTVPRAVNFSHTVRAIFGVQLTGCTQVISADGRHIMEQYTFIARDLDLNSGTPETKVDGRPVAPKRISPLEVVKAPGVAKDVVRVTIKQVLDGDTLVLSDDSRMRVIGIDTPERAENHEDMTADAPFAEDAYAFTRQLTEGKPVWVKAGIDPVDGYGHKLGWVWAEDGLFLSYELLKRGLGKVMIIGNNNLYADAIKYAEKMAKNAKIGVWSDANGVAAPESGSEEYVTAYGDSLSSIAEKKMGNALLWGKLYEANRTVIGDNPNRIRPGTKLIIP